MNAQERIRMTMTYFIKRAAKVKKTGAFDEEAYMLGVISGLRIALEEIDKSAQVALEPRHE